MTPNWTAFHGAAALALVAAFATPASADSARQIGEFRDWSAYATTEGSGTLCFALSKPTDVSPVPDGYTQAFLYLTNRPGEGLRNELNLVAGYTFAADTPATLSVGGQNFELFTENDAAWLDNPALGPTLAGVMRAGSNLVVEGTSDKGIKIRQTFSLSGATAASRAMDSQC